MSLSAEYRSSLEKWVPFAKSYIFSPQSNPDIAVYGMGDSGHWSIQAHCTALSALMVLAMDPDTNFEVCQISKEKLTNLCKKMFRFLTGSHISGNGSCLDGKKWGHHWISSLGTERLLHATIAFDPEFHDSDREALKNLIVSEADWLTDNYEIVADPMGRSGKNKPESNIWNGCMCYRASALCPDSPRAPLWREKAANFFANGNSIPEDAENDSVIYGKKVSERYVGHNFFSSMSLDHHAYMNTGYMVICLSNIAMLHFQLKALGLKAPEELYFHADKVWALLKKCMAPDGRLLRVGGDSRIRYCYCQDYCLPMWMFVADYFGEDISSYENGWLSLIGKEQGANSDGSFLGDRLSVMKENSRLYYTRLEGDRASTFGMMSLWHRLFGLEENKNTESSFVTNGEWHDDYHGSVLSRGVKRFASWTWDSCENPQGLCLPLADSTIAEYRYNLAGVIKGDSALTVAEMPVRNIQSFEGGFCISGKTEAVTSQALAEGVAEDRTIGEIRLAFAALPDDSTVVGLQLGRALNGAFIKSFKAMNLQIPNDVFNDKSRSYRYATGSLDTSSGRKRALDMRSPWFNIDDKMTVYKIYGKDELSITSNSERTNGLKEPDYKHLHLGGALYQDEICLGRDDKPSYHDNGDVLFDIGFALRCESSDKAGDMNNFVRIDNSTEAENFFRAVSVKAEDQKIYILAANFSDQDITGEFTVEAAKTLKEVDSGNEIKSEKGKVKTELKSCEAKLFAVEF